MNTYTHNPTEVEAILVEKPWAGVQRACAFARPIKSGRGALEFFVISNPGELQTFRAYPGDWIIRYPNGFWTVQDDGQFQRNYGEIAEEVVGDDAPVEVI